MRTLSLLPALVVVGLAGYGAGHIGNGAGGVTQCNLVQIDGQPTNSNSAVLHLRQLDIRNDSGSALVAWSTGGDGSGIDAAGHHGIKGTGTAEHGSGMHLDGASVGVGGDGLSVQGYGGGAGFAAHGGDADGEGGIFG